MLEKDFQSLFAKWLKYNWQKSSAFELKFCKDTRFNLKRVEFHQLRNLKIAKDGLFYYKIPDTNLAQNPFDCFSLHKSDAYIVIMWYKPRQEKIFYMIDVDTIKGLTDDNVKSITEEDAKKLANISGILKT